MGNYYRPDRSSRPALAIGTQSTDLGLGIEPNPGEAPTPSSLGAARLQSRPEQTALGRGVIDIGAQVGIMRNLEYSAGSRSHRVSSGPYTSA